MATVQRYVFISGGILLGLAALFATTTGTDKSSFLQVFAVCGATIAAAASVGGLTGFLFGIPRLLQRMEGGRGGDVTAGQEAGHMTFIDLRNGHSRSVGGNSNLEEVSDWLTKIIVGLTLVHLADIKSHLLTLSVRLADATGAGSEHASLSGFMLCLILAGFVVGFLSIYLEARTRVAALISDTELMLDGGALNDTAIQVSYNAGIMAPISEDNPLLVRSATATVEDSALLAFPYSKLSTAQDFAAWGAAQARNGNYVAAVRAITDAIAQEPGNQDYLLMLADVRRLQRLPDAEFDVLQEALNQGRADDTLLRRILLVALYTRPPEGFRFVLAQAKSPQFSTLANDPDVLLYYAAALGQEAKWIHNNPGTRTPAEVAQAVHAIADDAYQTLQQIEAIVPTPDKGARKIARLLFDPKRPGGIPTENDLEVFDSDTRFQKLLTP